MNKASSQKVKLTALMIFTVAIMVITGCSNTPLAPGSDDNSSVPQVLSRASHDTGGIELAPVNLYVEEVISSELGGTLSVLDVTLTIPPGAVDNDTLFSIFIPDDEMFYNEFGTSGLVFDKPVTVSMSFRDADLSGVDESTIRIGWLNPRTGEWEDMKCTVDHATKTVTGELDHFSAYALVSD